MHDEINVFCDFDGTIAERDVTDTLLEAYALPEWREVEALWRAGAIGSRECMRRQVELLSCSRREMDELIDSVSIDPDFPAFAAACRQAGVPLAVLSDGIDYAIRRILTANGLGWLPVFSNSLEEPEPGCFALRFPHAAPACPSGTCKCALMRKLCSPGARMVFIGDGASDFCAARLTADFVLAKDSLLRFCREHTLPHAAYADFADVAQMLGLQAGPSSGAQLASRSIIGLHP